MVYLLHKYTIIEWYTFLVHEKYLNEGIVVRDCAYECKSGVHELSEFFCCQEDGCNNAPNPQRPVWTVLLTVLVHLVLWSCVHLSGTHEGAIQFQKHEILMEFDDDFVNLVSIRIEPNQSVIYDSRLASYYGKNNYHPV
ncbi:hypothetical protein HNY73_020895 [Argiope bruennichi]|uniref:Uncharacterized protein n=1 Tax=Argiope bruennichi TaxID=94029 RepID=A0A8T0ED18_ARGBR|nr:hypothetical protein HNY73_020895 [Argiope bruennichi]